MTFDAILRDTYARLGFADVPAVSVQTRLKGFANAQHRQLLTLPGLTGLRDSTLPVTVVAAQPTSVLPQATARLLQIVDRTIQQRTLEELSLEELRHRDPARTSSGEPWAFARGGLVEVAVQPVDASELFVKSTSASDTNAASIEGLRTGGYPIALTATMTGVTAKSLGTAYTDLVEVTKFSVSVPAIGTITLHEDSGVGAELARIPIGQTNARYQVLHWHPVPVANRTFYADVTRTVLDLVLPNDEPLVPQDFHDLIGLGILRREYEMKGDKLRLMAVAAEERARTDALRYFVQSSGTGTIARRPRRHGWSMLGHNYPSGS